ncbi:hypothetical protein GXW78_06065 [Roseomonas terrae]|uniref:Uncharacterized protein n=1 Tax=Neoroseomonas terrae TaxID=424799 RepID=A0ABS5EDX5_9PROT|nr:hypothetical protein [Neoroseomonas terrae]MBR0649219.1 hypothetical protein [Neoroseomonas terrae]
MSDHIASGVPRGARQPHISAAREFRSDDDLAFHENAIVTAAALHLAEHRHVVLSYSGGAESGPLLHLLRPFRQSFTVVWNSRR